MKNKIEVEIFGQKYPLRSTEPEEHVRRVAKFVDGVMREVAERTGLVSSLQIAVLAALYIADEYIKCESEKEELRKKLKEQVERLEQFVKEEL